MLPLQAPAGEDLAAAEQIAGANQAERSPGQIKPTNHTNRVMATVATLAVEQANKKGWTFTYLPKR